MGQVYERAEPRRSCCSRWRAVSGRAWWRQEHYCSSWRAQRLHPHSRLCTCVIPAEWGCPTHPRGLRDGGPEKSDSGRDIGVIWAPWSVPFEGMPLPRTNSRYRFRATTVRGRICAAAARHGSPASRWRQITREAAVAIGHCRDQCPAGQGPFSTRTRQLRATK